MSTRLRSAAASTAVGAIGIVWSDHGISRTWMHAGTVERARAQIRREYPDAVETAPSEAVASSLDAIVAALAGAPIDLSGVALDMRTIPEFDRRVYDITRSIRAGSTMTYGEIAKRMGEEPMRARDVGQALGRNPFAPIVPCHRVVAAGGRLGGYSAPGGAATKRRLLELEGADIVKVPQQRGFFDDLGL